MINFIEEDPTKDSSSKKSLKKGDRSIPRLTAHLNTLDQGMEAFMQWLRSENKMSNTSNPVILKEFVHTKYSVLYDNTIGKTVTVETPNGVPFCKSCNADNCGHVGFAILLEQKYETDGSVAE
ncbi:MAG TPA: hypothetical protein VE378_06055 [Nitrososphaeraceae archaeon]|nr:hypothetical protein [Nitrososphaeraceae archaeon]